MLYKNKRDYGDKVINVIRVIPEMKNQKSDYDRVFYTTPDSCEEHWLYAGDFEACYESITDFTGLCPHCGKPLKIS